MKKHSMFCFLILGIIFLMQDISAQENTAYLEISLGKVQGGCSESDESLLGKAHLDAILRLGQGQFAMERVSDWNQNVYTKGFPFAPDECRSKEAWAEAAFVHRNDINKRWILIVSSSFTKHKGDNMSDEEAFNHALDNGRKRASLFCKGQLVEEPIFVYEKIKKFLDWYDLFSLRAQLECIH